MLRIAVSPGRQHLMHLAGSRFDGCHGAGLAVRMVNAAALRAIATARAAALAFAVASTLTPSIGHFGLISPARAQPAALTAPQSEALDRYTEAANEFKSILRQRRAQIDAKQPLPNLPGQALYLAR